MNVEVSKEIRKEIISWLKVVVFAVFFALVINNLIIVNAKVPTGSMEKTIMIGDRIVASRLAYRFSEPKRLDVVVFRFPDDPQWLYVKRVIGMPGETLEIRDGKVYIDDSAEPLEEPYLPETPVGNFGPVKIPEGRYFMMGDNRNNSNDARFWENKYLEKEKMLGKVEFKYFPGFKFIEKY